MRGDRSGDGAVGFAALVVLVAGCDGCPGDRPYTPYTLDAGATSSASGSSRAAPEPSGTAAPDAGPAFAVVRGEKAPGDGRTWPLPGGKIADAPTGRSFDVGLVVGADLLAWASAPGHSRGELWLYPGAAPETRRVIVALPAELSARGCEASASLARVGPSTATVEVSLGGAECKRSLDEPDRWVSVVRLPGVEAVLELFVEASPPGESLSLALDGSDVDGDGRDDVTATVALSGVLAPFPKDASVQVTAPIRWFDRPAGFSRDATEPEQSLRARAATLLGEARKKATALAALTAARQLRRLRAAVCEDDRAPRVRASAGPIRCGETRSLEDIVHAEGIAALTLRDPGRALAATSRLAALSSGEAGPRRKELERQFAKDFGEVAAAKLHVAQAVPSGGPGLELGPLAFEPSGDLLVRTAEGTVRVAASGFAESPAEDVPPWPKTIAAGSPGLSLNAIEQRCSAPTLTALVQLAGARAEVPVPVLVPVQRDGLPVHGACSGLGSVRARALDVAPAGLVVSIGGEVASIGPGSGGAPEATAMVAPLPLGPTTLGTARSPDGATVALPVARGILVWGATAKLWTGPFEGAWGCVPQNGGGRIACVVERAAVLFAPP